MVGKAAEGAGCGIIRTSAPSACMDTKEQRRPETAWHPDGQCKLHLSAVRIWDGRRSAIRFIHFVVSASKYSRNAVYLASIRCIVREREYGSFSIAREWTDWADPLHDVTPGRFDSESLFELVTLLEHIAHGEEKC